MRLAHQEGVPIVFGTDSLGHMHPRQNSEFRLRAAALSPTEVLQSATINAARLMKLEGQVGALIPGAYADLLIVDGEPTEDAAVLTDPARAIHLLMQVGRVIAPLT